MDKFEKLIGKPSKELLNLMAEESWAPTGTAPGDEKIRNRELIRTILDYRSANIAKWQNWIMVFLTLAIFGLTAMLVYKEFFVK